MTLQLGNFRTDARGDFISADFAPSEKAGHLHSGFPRRQRQSKHGREAERDQNHPASDQKSGSEFGWLSLADGKKTEAPQRAENRCWNEVVDARSLLRRSEETDEE